MSRIRPTRTEHGYEGCLVVSSEESCVRVIYTDRPPPGTGLPTEVDGWCLLTYTPEIARDVAKALRMLLAADYSPRDLLGVLPVLGFVGPRILDAQEASGASPEPEPEWDTWVDLAELESEPEPEPDEPDEDMHRRGGDR